MYKVITYKVITRSAAIIMLGLAATGVAQARGANFGRGGFTGGGLQQSVPTQTPHFNSTYSYTVPQGAETPVSPGQ
ncbi:MAG TPA: hypothetical protein VGJ20_45960 [Xanthobacteraceae bacterium]|jgi:hypothetical protein